MNHIYSLQPYYELPFVQIEPKRKKNNKVSNQSKICFETIFGKANFDYYSSWPVNKACLQKTAACLSNIELAIDNQDSRRFLFSLQLLADLFSIMNLEAAKEFTGNLLILAQENKMQDVKNELLKVKKFIAENLKY